MTNEILLCHYGVSGMKWGVRRYRTNDNKLTYEGIIRDRTVKANKTRDDVNSIINSMSKKDKKLLNIGKNEEYLAKEECQFVVKRFLYNCEYKPISFLDLLRNGDDLAVVIGTHSGKQYRGKGYSTKLITRGMNWTNKNKDKWNNVTWSARTNNGSSKHLAEKFGFKLNKETSNSKWSNYVYSQT